jgi:hypothetical protein
MSFPDLHECFKKIMMTLLGYLAGLAVLSVTIKPCHAQPGFNFDIRPHDEAAWLKDKVELDGFQYRQIKKIEEDYYSRILYSFREYASHGNRKQTALHMAMAFVDHHEKIKDLLDKKQKKKWNDLINKRRRATDKRLMKYRNDDGTDFNR